MAVTLFSYISLGFFHVIPWGLDHMLFVLCLLLPQTRLKPILYACTLFTLAHSVSLGLAALQIWVVDAKWIEPLITFSIFAQALQNLLLPNRWSLRMPILLAFGLIHGLGFASALSEQALPASDFFLSLFSFNMGVELAQIAFVCLIYFVIVRPFSNKKGYVSSFIRPANALIATIALCWTIERILSYP
jgi:hypothetical protein